MSDVRRSRGQAVLETVIVMPLIFLVRPPADRTATGADAHAVID